MEKDEPSEIISIEGQGEEAAQGGDVGGRGGRQANIRTHGSLLRSLVKTLWYLMWMEMMTHEDKQKSVELAIGHALLSAFLEYPVDFALNLAGL